MFWVYGHGERVNRSRWRQSGIKAIDHSMQFLGIDHVSRRAAVRTQLTTPLIQHWFNGHFQDEVYK